MNTHTHTHTSLYIELKNNHPNIQPNTFA